MKKIFSVLIVLAMVISLAACGNEENEGGMTDTKTTGTKEENKTQTNEEEVTIGYSVYWKSEFTTLMGEAMERYAAENNINLVEVDADSDASAQIGQVENFITQKVDSMIVAPVDVEAIIPAVDEAAAAGIPFVAVNMYVESDNVSAYSGPDDVQAGELEAQYVLDQIGEKGKVIIIQGADGYSATTDRNIGIHNVLDKEDGIEILTENTGEWDRAKSTTMMENYIQQWGDGISAVIAHNDEMALGAIQALKAAGMENDVVVVGIDAIEDGVNAVKEGTLGATVYQDAGKEGILALELAYKLATGEKLEQKDNLIDMILVTKDNVDEYITMYK